MKLNRKDKLIILIPLIIVAIMYPILPDKIPRQFKLDGSVSYMAKEFIFIIGLVPFAIYKSRQSKKK